MQTKAPPRTNDDLQEMRERRLVAFVAASIEGSAGARVTTTILAVARCGDSPVARALVALRPALDASGIAVRIIFSDEDATNDSFMASGTGPMPDVRVLRNPRLRDAHEQLIVQGAAVWFGDSLRRDMHRRDLFEQFLSDSPEAALLAARGFEQLWQRAEPCLTLAALTADSLTAIAGSGKPGNSGPTSTTPC
jgi:hypothetical protein